MKDLKESNRNKPYEQIASDFYKGYKDITLPPEYSYVINDNAMRFLIQLARYKFVARMLSRKDKVLEIGCGLGLGTIFLGQFCKSVKGIDTNKREILIAQSINLRKNVTFEFDNIFKYSKSSKYDVIVAIDVVEHLSETLGRKLISHTTRLLSDGGMFVIGTPSVYSYKYEGKLSKVAHIKLYDQQELVAILEKYYKRVIPFSMNDELVHTGFSKLSWYYFALSFMPKGNANKQK